MNESGNKLPTNMLLRFCEWVADLFLLNVLWILCSLPVVTIGASTSAVHYVIIKKLRKESTGTIRGFFTGFKKSFKQATILWVIYLALLADAAILLYMYCGGIPTVAQITGNLAVAFGTLVFAVLWLFTFMYSFPMLAILELRLIDCFRNSLILSTRHILNTLIILITAVMLILLLNIVYVLAIIVIGVIFYVWSALVYKTLIPYLKKEDAEGGQP